LLRIIANDLASNDGEKKYHFEKNDIAPWLIAKDHVAYITQELAPWKGNMYEYVIFSAVTHGFSPTAAQKSAKEVMQLLDIEDLAARKWSEISGGYKLRFALAAAYVWQPKLIVLDEPLANLDITTQRMILDSLKAFAKKPEHPAAVIISSQHLLEIESVSDDLIYIDNGQIKFSGNFASFGTDRAENTFELHCSATEAQLKTLLGALGEVSVQSSGMDYILRTSLDIDASSVLKTLIDNDLEIVYFRNISQSSKKLFIHE
jgi:ABC-2 type transport system ATP-binding protein